MRHVSRCWTRCKANARVGKTIVAVVVGRGFQATPIRGASQRIQEPERAFEDLNAISSGTSLSASP